MSQFVTVNDYFIGAKSRLPKSTFDYYNGGATEETTLYDNREAYKRYLFIPRMLVDVSKRNLQTTLLGKKVSMPIGLAPVAMQRLAHESGELATVRASLRCDVGMILSTVSTTSLEDVYSEGVKWRASTPPLPHFPPRWFQLYIFKERAITERLIRRVESCGGYDAIVLTVDTPLSGQRWADVRNKFAMPSHLRMANFAEPASTGQATDSTNAESLITGKQTGFSEYANRLFDPSLHWSRDLAWLRSITRLPIILKGILHPGDVLLAKQYDVAAIIVSNHGARQLDGVPATLDALPACKRALGDDSQCELYVDGGVRTGADVLKALALGARAVFIGRPIVFGLACEGEDGVVNVLEILRRELDVAMALAGITDVGRVEDSLVMQRDRFLSKL